ncbi:MAG TPA: TrmH family RNA methyltransferase [Methylophilaceae bacterium]|jgi:TrmH family RNA methyltransferase
MGIHTAQCLAVIAPYAGLSDKLIKAASKQVRVPMPGNVESLNAAAAAAICLFERVRQTAG